MNRQFAVFLVFLFISTTYSAQVLPERERADLVDRVLEERFNKVLPQIMYRTGIDMWVIIGREYNEDPILKTMLPATWLNARRRTILVFSYEPSVNKLEKFAISRYNVGENFKAKWDKEKQPEQWQALVELIKAENPDKIAIDQSHDFALADGLTTTDHKLLMQNLPDELKKKVVPAEPLAVGWLETRSALEMQLYEELVGITHNIIKNAFSGEVIEPGKTTTDDVVWYLRQRVTDMGLETWFHPTVDIQRSNEQLASHIESFSDSPKDKVIQPGDLLHCDFGITYLRLNTDCQQHAYVLKPGESNAPEFLNAALAKGNQLQDIFTLNFETGKTGNEILAKSLSEAKEQGLQPSIYTHPLGLHGHAAGPTIGMWDSQEGVPGVGDYPLYENTAYAIELNTTVTIAEWNKDIRFMLEEAGFWGPKGFRYVNGRQEKLLLID